VHAAGYAGLLQLFVKLAGFAIFVQGACPLFWLYSLVQGSLFPLFACMYMSVYSDLLVSSFVSLFDLYNYLHLIKKECELMM